MSDPKRLLDELGGGELKDLLHAGKTEVPDDTKLLELAAKMGIAGALGGLGGAGAAGAGGAGGAGAGGAGAGAGAGAGGAGAAKLGASAAVATKGALAVKIGVAVAVVSLAGAGTVAVTSKKAAVEDTQPSGIVATATTSAAPMGATSVTLPPRIDPLSVPSTEPSATSSAKTTTSATARPKAEDEVKLLERAQDALKSRPEEALALCNEHAKSYPNGMLAQEREVIAVEALVKTGRTAEAKARAEKFKARFPGSSHARRIDAIVGP